MHRAVYRHIRFGATQKCSAGVTQAENRNENGIWTLSTPQARCFVGHGGAGDIIDAADVRVVFHHLPPRPGVQKQAYRVDPTRASLWRR